MLYKLNFVDQVTENDLFIMQLFRLPSLANINQVKQQNQKQEEI